MAFSCGKHCRSRSHLSARRFRQSWLASIVQRPGTALVDALHGLAWLRALDAAEDQWVALPECNLANIEGGCDCG
jgi:hypothetical protein